MHDASGRFHLPALNAKQRVPLNVGAVDGVKHFRDAGCEKTLQQLNNGSGIAKADKQTAHDGVCASPVQTDVRLDALLFGRLQERSNSRWVCAERSQPSHVHYRKLRTVIEGVVANALEPRQVCDVDGLKPLTSLERVASDTAQGW